MKSDRFVHETLKFDQISEEFTDLEIVANCVLG